MTTQADEVKVTQADESLARIIRGTFGGDYTFPRLEELLARHRQSSQPLEPQGEETYAEWQQKRGMLADKVDWAINEYDEFMKDDAYDAQRVLDRIVTKLRQTRELYGFPEEGSYEWDNLGSAHPQPQAGGEGLEVRAEKVLASLGYYPEANIKLNWLDARNAIVAAMSQPTDEVGS